MKKKKQRPGNDLSPDLDLKSIIHQNSLFFDKLIELIPARFYLPTDDEEKPWFQGLSKAQKASAKQEARENIKKARRDRLDPEKASTTTLDLLKQSLENEKSNADKLDSEGDDEEVEINPMIAGMEADDNRSVTYEELRQRLRRRIEELRSGRNSGGSDQQKMRNLKTDKREIEQKKRKRNIGSEEEKKPRDSNSLAKVEKDVSEASKELAFSYVKLGNAEERGKKKRKLSRLEELERAKKLQEAKNDPEKGEIISKKHSWKAATSRAAGIKIHDDPKLLKQSIHKEKKRHHKNVGKWKERIETQENKKAEKQKKRSENISGRIEKKKMRRIAKREKKLMRPGFEGRKEGFINQA
ncbi:hypothetical protein L1049_003940 [Liquidambar formosana]|uniref:Ribosomal RNA-processing protein 14/surfeit locus protein 6 C-terminal domain-containing protein n=1 Tax=Liquidambar formosana TaxID=63359 RepID=A0AAP0X0A6_LIQFO